MSITLFIGIIPLLIFVILDSISNLKVALIGAVIMAVFELAFSVLYFNEIDIVTILSFVLVVVLAFFSYKKENPIHLKMQPVLLSFAFGFTFIIGYLLDYPIFYILSLKYKSSLPEKFTELLSYPIFVDFLTLASLYMGYSFILHAIATWITAVRLSNWSWILMRGVGFYFFSFLAILLAKWRIGI
jgi:intracellular septation protein A